MAWVEVFDILKGRPYYSVFATVFLAALLILPYVLPTEGAVWGKIIKTLDDLSLWLSLGLIAAFFIATYAWASRISVWRKNRVERAVREKERAKQAEARERNRRSLQEVLDKLKAARPTRETFETRESIEDWSEQVVPLLGHNKNHQSNFVNQIGYLLAGPSSTTGRVVINNIKSIIAAAIGDIEDELRTRAC
ncbi:MAG: hypothetical protein AB1814_10375 [Thermodesulfobacteriota bacterium]